MKSLPWFRRPFFISLLLGLLGFYFAQFTLSYNQQPFNLTIVWSFIFPVLAGLSYGWKYGLLAGTLGLGAFFPFVLWFNNGWALFLVTLVYLFWYTSSGYFAQMRKVRKTWWNHPLVGLVPSLVLYNLLVGLGYPLLFHFNPPFWNPAALTDIAADTLWGIVLKDILTMVVVQLMALVLLRLNPIRRILGLEAKTNYRKNVKFFAMILIAFSALWYLVLVCSKVLLRVHFPDFFFISWNANEVLLAFILICTDVAATYIIIGHLSRTVEAEESLIVSESHFRESLESLPVSVGILSKSGKILFLNKLFIKTFGYTLQDIPDMTAWVLQVYPDQEYLEKAAKDWEADTKAGDLDSEFISSREYKMRVKDGSFKQVLVTTRSVGDTYFCTFQDVTTQNLLLEAVQKNVKLEALGLLAGGIAHDFNNLLAGIFGNIQLAVMADSGEKKKTYLESCLKLMTRSRGLTQQLLTFAKGGIPEIHTEKLFPFLQDTAVFALSGSGVNCEFKIDPNLWACSCDKSQISQVMDNLIINARQAMGSTGRILVTAENTVLGESNTLGIPGGNFVKISVEDNGPGIPEEVIERIFDPFFTTKTHGHGLGLATSHSIIKKHGGVLEVHSHPGQGAVFTFYLPGVSAPVEETPNDMIFLKGRSGGRILVVDDELYIREMLEKMLSHMGFLPISFSRGEDAIALMKDPKLKPRNVRGAILDLTIPGGMGGRDLAVELRKIAPQVEIYLISGYADDPLLSDYESLGIKGTLRKPFHMEDLERMLGYESVIQNE